MKNKPLILSGWFWHHRWYSWWQHWRWCGGQSWTRLVYRRLGRPTPETKYREWSR